MCEKENPVTRKLDHNMFESLEVELAFNVLKKKKKKRFQKLLPIHMQVHVFSTFVTLKGKEGGFLTAADGHILYHTSLLQRLKGLVGVVCELPFFGMEYL